MAERKGKTVVHAIGAVVFGSDQGLVGQFNDVVADHAVKTLASFDGQTEVWAVGERVHGAPDGLRPAADRTLLRAGLRQGHHPPRRADPRGCGLPPQSG